MTGAVRFPRELLDVDAQHALVWVEYLASCEAFDRALPGYMSERGEWIPRPDLLLFTAAFSIRQHGRLERAVTELVGAYDHDAEVVFAERALVMTQEERLARLAGRSPISEVESFAVPR